MLTQNRSFDKEVSTEQAKKKYSPSEIAETFYNREYKDLTQVAMAVGYEKSKGLYTRLVRAGITGGLSARDKMSKKVFTEKLEQAEIEEANVLNNLFSLKQLLNPLESNDGRLIAKFNIQDKKEKQMRLERLVNYIEQKYCLPRELINTALSDVFPKTDKKRRREISYDPEKREEAIKRATEEIAERVGEDFDRVGRYVERLGTPSKESHFFSLRELHRATLARGHEYLSAALIGMEGGAFSTRLSRHKEYLTKNFRVSIEGMYGYLKGISEEKLEEIIGKEYYDARYFSTKNYTLYQIWQFFQELDKKVKELKTAKSMSAGKSKLEKEAREALSHQYHEQGNYFLKALADTFRLDIKGLLKDYGLNITKEKFRALTSQEVEDLGEDLKSNALMQIQALLEEHKKNGYAENFVSNISFFNSRLKFIDIYTSGRKHNWDTSKVEKELNCEFSQIIHYLKSYEELPKFDQLKDIEEQEALNYQESLVKGVISLQPKKRKIDSEVRLEKIPLCDIHDLVRKNTSQDSDRCLSQVASALDIPGKAITIYLSRRWKTDIEELLKLSKSDAKKKFSYRYEEIPPKPLMKEVLKNLTLRDVHTLMLATPGVRKKAQEIAYELNLLKSELLYFLKYHGVTLKALQGGTIETYETMLPYYDTKGLPPKHAELDNKIKEHEIVNSYGVHKTILSIITSFGLSVGYICEVLIKHKVKIRESEEEINQLLIRESQVLEDQVLEDQALYDKKWKSYYDEELIFLPENKRDFAKYEQFNQLKIQRMFKENSEEFHANHLDEKIEEKLAVAILPNHGIDALCLYAVKPIKAKECLGKLDGTILFHGQADKLDPRLRNNPDAGTFFFTGYYGKRQAKLTDTRHNSNILRELTIHTDQRWVNCEITMSETGEFECYTTRTIQPFEPLFLGEGPTTKNSTTNQMSEVPYNLRDVLLAIWRRSEGYKNLKLEDRKKMVECILEDMKSKEDFVCILKEVFPSKSQLEIYPNTEIDESRQGKKYNDANTLGSLQSQKRGRLLSEGLSDETGTRTIDKRQKLHSSRKVVESSGSEIEIDVDDGVMSSDANNSEEKDRTSPSENHSESEREEAAFQEMEVSSPQALKRNELAFANEVEERTDTRIGLSSLNPKNGERYIFFSSEEEILPCEEELPCHASSEEFDPEAEEMEGFSEKEGNTEEVPEGTLFIQVEKLNSEGEYSDEERDSSSNGMQEEVATPPALSQREVLRPTVGGKSWEAIMQWDKLSKEKAKKGLTEDPSSSSSDDSVPRPTVGGKSIKKIEELYGEGNENSKKNTSLHAQGKRNSSSLMQLGVFKNQFQLEQGKKASEGEVRKDGYVGLGLGRHREK